VESLSGVIQLAKVKDHKNEFMKIAFNVLATNFCTHHLVQRSTVLIVWPWVDFSFSQKNYSHLLTIEKLIAEFPNFLSRVSSLKSTSNDQCRSLEAVKKAAPAIPVLF
jgi:hypothetical protein